MSIDGIKRRRSGDDKQLSGKKIEVRPVVKSPRPPKKKNKKPADGYIKGVPEPTRKMLLWIFVGFFITIILLFWFIMMRKTLFLSEPVEPSTNLEATELKKDLKDTLAELKEGFASIKEVATTAAPESKPQLSDDQIDALKDRLFEQADLNTQQYKNIRLGYSVSFPNVWQYDDLGQGNPAVFVNKDVMIEIINEADTGENLTQYVSRKVTGTAQLKSVQVAGVNALQKQGTVNDISVTATYFKKDGFWYGLIIKGADLTKSQNHLIDYQTFINTFSFLTS